MIEIVGVENKADATDQSRNKEFLFPVINKRVVKMGIEKISKGKKNIVVKRVDRSMAGVEMHRSFLAQLRNGDA